MFGVHYPAISKQGGPGQTLVIYLGGGDEGLDFRLLSLIQTVYHQTLQGRQSSMKLISINNQNLNKCKFNILVQTTINFM